MIHNLYNPENITQYNIVPGLLGVILTMTMVMATSIALTRERERGTYENLLAMPTRPVEIMIGKIVPNIFVGAFQCALILLVAKFVFHVPMLGSFWLLAATSAIYITALLARRLHHLHHRPEPDAGDADDVLLLPALDHAVGIYLPVPRHARLGAVGRRSLPITHFLRIVRGILLKGNGWTEVWPDVWPMILFLFVAGFIAVRRFRKTLD